MKKLILKINNENELIYPVDGYILGIDKYSICFEKKFSIDEIKEIKNNTNKELFVALNRSVYNDELEEYKNILLELDNIGLNGIIVGDIAALTYGLKTSIILDQLHLNNSFYSINHYKDINGVVLTNDITKDEINEIKNNSNKLLFKQLFGLVHLSTSVRSLVSNYKEFANINDNSDYNLICEPKRDDYYYIVEDSFGTHILNNKILNLYNYKEDINYDYGVLDFYLINKDKELDIINKYNGNGEIDIDNLYDCDDGFIDKKTIYRVKNNE